MIASCTARKIHRRRISARDYRVSEIRLTDEQTPIDSLEAPRAGLASMLSLSPLILEQTLLLRRSEVYYSCTIGCPSSRLSPPHVFGHVDFRVASGAWLELGKVSSVVVLSYGNVLSRFPFRQVVVGALQSWSVSNGCSSLL